MQYFLRLKENRKYIIFFTTYLTGNVLQVPSDLDPQDWAENRGIHTPFTIRPFKILSDTIPCRNNADFRTSFCETSFLKVRHLAPVYYLSSPKVNGYHHHHAQEMPTWVQQSFYFRYFSVFFSYFGQKTFSRFCISQTPENSRKMRLSAPVYSPSSPKVNGCHHHAENMPTWMQQFSYFRDFNVFFRTFDRKGFLRPLKILEK